MAVTIHLPLRHQRRVPAASEHQLRRERVAAHPGPPSPPRCESLPADFETEEKAIREDRLRARRIRRVAQAPGPMTWINLGDRMWLASEVWGNALPAPTIDRVAALNLAERLEAGLEEDWPAATLASSARMRIFRLELLLALLDGFADYPDAELRTVTVIYERWSLPAAELDGITAARIKQQFQQHLVRVGVTKMPGPLFAVLHGELEPKSGRYQLHFHVWTTAAKAAAMKARLTKKTIKGYRVTATGAAPIRRSKTGNRVDQSSYLAKSFWPARPVLTIKGQPKRVRDPRRIPEPWGTQVLLWLDRQRFRDLVLMNGCWSPRNGGTEAMRRLYLIVMGAG